MNSSCKFSKILFTYITLECLTELLCSFFGDTRSTIGVSTHKVLNKIDHIVGGDDCRIEDWPFFVQLRLTATPICGASLINSNWILSAAHCLVLANLPLDKIYAVTGISWMNDTKSPNCQKSKLMISHIHPLYNVNDSFTRHDIAVVKLKTPMHETDSVKFVKLPNLYRNLHSLCDVGTAIGIGDQRQKVLIDSRHTLISAKKYRPHLQCVNLFVPPRDFCLRFASIVLFPMSFCALSTEGGNDTCQGDSGGPFMCGNVQVGIISRGIGCGMEGVAGSYTMVEFYDSFISYAIADEETKSVSNVPHSKLMLIVILIICVV